jgi:ATP-dependent helicase HrpA
MMNPKPSSPELARPIEEVRDAAPIDYPTELPITQYRDELVQLIRNHQVIIVCGETGSGKSTQLPKFCLEAGLGHDKMIGHTQPRRLAARSIAARLAEELKSSVGGQVGFKIRFGDQTSDQTQIKLMTDGILLAETGSDRSLDAYDAIIIDEAHERSLNIDFLMGYLRKLQAKRPDLKIIITSATIDADRFAQHFADGDTPAPIISVEGRGYPVEIRYLPWEEINNDETRNYDLSRHVIEAIQALSRDGGGDTLVFLPTERDIREVSHRVSGHYKRMGMEGRVDLLPLYARLPSSQQQKIFKPDGKKQRIIFATNVAESSLTVPGIRYVIDSGTARISRYSPRSKVQRLPVEPVSQASSNQRSGRCGRVGPGICVRLFSQEDFDSRDAFTTPEIRRTNLASVVLQMKSLRLGRLEDFPLLDPPRDESIREGLRTLTELGAIDDRHELTAIGRKLGRMPVDPRVGRIILAADENGVLAEVLPIAAAMEIPDPRDRPPEKQQAADEAHAPFTDSQSDFLSYLRLWRYYEDARSNLSRSKLERSLRKQFLSPNRMREWSDIYRQLREMASSQLGDRKSKRKIGKIRFLEDDPKFIVGRDHYEAIHQSLLAGLLSGVAMVGDKNQYTGAGGLKLFLWPGSGVFENKPKWIVAAELVETAKQYARTVAKIQPGWVEKVGAHLLKSSHFEPHFSSKSGGAFCYQNQTLFGLPVVTRRRLPLAPIDPVTARELLIEPGLVDGELRTNARFVRRNENLKEMIATLAAKTRRRDLVIDDYVVAGFYQERLPETVVDRARLEKFDRELEEPAWVKTLTDSAAVSQWLSDPPPPDLSPSLYMRPDELVAAETSALSGEAFPDELVVGSSRLPIQYRFEPGSERDGINVTVHQAALSQVSDDRLGWLVPGLLHDKIVNLIKSLPKRIRRNLIPAADVAAKMVDELKEDYGKLPFMTAVCQVMSRHAEMPISPSDFQDDKLSSHLDFLVTVVDDEGQPVAEDRSITALSQKLRTAAVSVHTEGSTEDSEVVEDWTRKSMTTFDIEEIPREVVRMRGGVQVAQYPGLVVEKDVVRTKLYPDALSAEESLRIGCIELFALTERKELRGQVRWLPALEQAKVKLSGIVSSKDLEASLARLLARIAFIEKQPAIRTKEEFDLRSSQRGRRIAQATQEVATWLGNLADGYFEVRRELESFGGNQRYADACTDIRDQLTWMTFDSFMAKVPWNWLTHYPRYFRAMAYRIDKLRSGSATKDSDNMQTVGQLWLRWQQTLPIDQRDPTSQASSEFRWMTEELRVSLFAQPLGTATKVSPKRCEKLIS